MSQSGTVQGNERELKEGKIEACVKEAIWRIWDDFTNLVVILANFAAIWEILSDSAKTGVVW